MDVFGRFTSSRYEYSLTLQCRQSSSSFESEKTLFVNGPPGVYEEEISAVGTVKLWKAVEEAEAFTVAGGGDTVTSFTRFTDISKLDYVSTAGGALIRYLSGVKLPLIEAMRKAYDRT